VNIVNTTPEREAEAEETLRQSYLVVREGGKWVQKPGGVTFEVEKLAQLDSPATRMLALARQISRAKKRKLEIQKNANIAL
jgi:hypothetical protein